MQKDGTHETKVTLQQDGRTWLMECKDCPKLGSSRFGREDVDRVARTHERATEAEARQKRMDEGRGRE
jgi:hypothetical protein